MNLSDVFSPTDTPRCVHRLAVVLQFIDAFTGAIVSAPLSVSIPTPGAVLRPPTPWLARRDSGDSTYRFIATNADVPTGTFDVAVEAAGGEYVNLEPVTVTLPMVPPGPVPPHPAAPRRADEYLVQKVLWPTTRLRPPPGETAIRGTIASTGGASVAGLRVIVFTAGDPVPASPYTRTDEQGQFLFRLPALQSRLVGGAVVSTASLAVEVRNAADNVLVVVPAGPYVVDVGRVSVLSITIP